MCSHHSLGTYTSLPGGSGITAFVPIIEAALRNSRDKRQLRLLCLIGGGHDHRDKRGNNFSPSQKPGKNQDDRHSSVVSSSNEKNEKTGQGQGQGQGPKQVQVPSIFEETLLEHVQLLHASMTKSQIEEKRFEALIVTKGRRFDVGMLMPWLAPTNTTGS